MDIESIRQTFVDGQVTFPFLYDAVKFLLAELDAINQGLPQLGKARTCGGCGWCDESGFCDNENSPMEWTNDYPDFYCGDWKSPEP